MKVLCLRSFIFIFQGLYPLGVEHGGVCGAGHHVTRLLLEHFQVLIEDGEVVMVFKIRGAEEYSHI